MTNSNHPVPLFGLGTFRLKDQVVIDSVKNALELGYRAIDTAQFYENEGQIGHTIEASGVSRDELFITTKVWPPNFAEDKLLPSIKESLTKLKTDHVDLVLAHWPSPKNEVPMGDYLGGFAKAKADGMTKHFGVSNFTVALLKAAIGIVGADQIATNQIEVHPYLQNRKVIDFAKEQGIQITSYMTLAVGKVLKDPVIEAIAKAHDATPAQVTLAWAMQQGIAVIPSSTSREHLEGNMKAQQLKLSDADMKKIAELDRGERLANPEALHPAWD